MVEELKHISLSLTHNEHNAVYDSIEKYVQREHVRDSFYSEDDRQVCVSQNEIWELQWYPDTPVGSYHVSGPTLEGVVETALLIQREQIDRPDFSGGQTMEKEA